MAATNKSKEMAAAKEGTVENTNLPPERVVVEDGQVGIKAEATTMNINTTDSMKASKTNAQLANEVKVAQAKFKSDAKGTVNIPAALAGKLGSIHFASINGVSVNIPVDGEDHEVPQVFVKHIKNFLKDLK